MIKIQPLAAKPRDSAHLNLRIFLPNARRGKREIVKD
jgi:hypothetical protein